ncbi:MAG TPA: sugar phosphate nucleotidyltransferase, partial [Treponemataceae bacterium]|nr:sugar phosphate nucleotidyltransferase [Treponemataceae bacterium]
HYIILAGDQLYRMDLDEFLRKHEESGADITIACTAVNRADASGFGILKTDAKGRITEFMEKPGPTKDISDWIIPDGARTPAATGGRDYLASMGIYIFNSAAMEESLNNELTDFGKEIIPAAIKQYAVSAYVYDGYWEDIGTIKSFYDATLDLTGITPKFNFYDEDAPIYTHNRNLPSSKINSARLDQVNASEGCVITNAAITRSVIGIRSIIESGTTLEGVICMGADLYETDAEKADNGKRGIPNIGIGRDCAIRRAIIDKNARIGNRVTVGMGATPADGDYGYYHVIDGIYVITKNAVVPDGTSI